jgi:hypothetical protein
LHRIGTEPQAQKEGKGTVPQFQRTSLEQVEPLGKLEQTEVDGLLLSEQSPVGNPKEE